MQRFVAETERLFGVPWWRWHWWVSSFIFIVNTSRLSDLAKEVNKAGISHKSGWEDALALVKTSDKFTNKVSMKKLDCQGEEQKIDHRHQAYTVNGCQMGSAHGWTVIISIHHHHSYHHYTHIHTLSYITLLLYIHVHSSYSKFNFISYCNTSDSTMDTLSYITLLLHIHMHAS